MAAGFSGGGWGHRQIPARAFYGHYGVGAILVIAAEMHFFGGEAGQATETRLGLAREESVDGSGELLASLKELELEDEDEAQKVAAHLLDHFAGRVGRATLSIVSMLSYLGLYNDHHPYQWR